MRVRGDDRHREPFGESDDEPRGPMSRGIVRGGLALLFVVVLVVGVASIAGPRSGASPAQSPTTDEAAADEAPADEGGQAPGEVAVVVDSSESMADDARADDLPDAVGALVDGLPDEVGVGLYAYGSEVEAPDLDALEAVEDDESAGGGFLDGLFGGGDDAGNGEDTDETGAEGGDQTPPEIAAACEDTRVLEQIGDADAENTVGALESLDAVGVAGVEHALRTAAADLSGDGPSSIVLVTGGAVDCEPPPCEAAAELAEQADVEIHVAGYGASGAEAGELECLARVTGGTYREADDAEALGEVLGRTADRIGARTGPTATDYEFAGSREEARFLGEGLYRSTLPAWAIGDEPPEQHYANVAVADEHTVHVSVTPYPAGTRSILDDEEIPPGEVSLTATNTSPECTTQQLPGTSSTIGVDDVPDAATITLSNPADGSCDPEGWSLRVTPAIDTESESDPVDIPLEISVQAEPSLPVTVMDTMTEPEEGDGRPGSVDVENPQPLVPGSSYNAATPINPGAYSAAIVPGEIHYFRVPVEWGERPAVTLRAGPSERDVAESISVSLANPMRTSLDSAPVNFYNDSVERTVGADRATLYRNRQLARPGPDVAMAGEHYLAVSMETAEVTAERGIEQDYEFAVEVSGEADDGPSWRPVTDPGPTPSEEPIAFGDGTTYEGEAEPPSEVAAEDDDTGGVSLLWGMLFGVGLLGIVVVAVVLGNRRQ